MTFAIGIGVVKSSDAARTAAAAAHDMLQDAPEGIGQQWRQSCAVLPGFWRSTSAHAAGLDAVICGASLAAVA
jgi:hypothetical protein